MVENGGNKGNFPDWMNPINDRKSPYTKKELDVLVEGFILDLDDQERLAMTSKFGAEEARERIRAGIIKMDANNLINITPSGMVN